MQHFLAYRDSRLVGRVSAIIDRNYVEFHEDKAGFVGFFEAEDDDSARALMEEDPAVVKGIMRAEVFPYRIAFTSMKPC